jgi:hypothetical protein
MDTPPIFLNTTFVYISKYNESQVTEANNLKVTIGALKLAGRNETQTLKV